MYIKEAIFKNFQNFKTGMDIEEISFDFTTMRNPVCIIIGPNGIGKTSLLSYLTPFATMGTLDIRESNRIIIPGKDGYKKIIFVDEEMNEFEIEHFYMYSNTKDTFSIKSYIKMNGKEMNANGNVTSFKELVYEYLNVDMSFLKLIRIGKNVSNLIMAKATERKTFMGKILDDVDWYLKRFKAINMKERDLKILMAHTIDELKKTEIEDEEITLVEIKNMNNSLLECVERIEELNSKKSTLEYQLSELNLDRDSNRELTKLEKTIEKLSISLKEAKDKDYTSEKVSSIILELEKTIDDQKHNKDLISKDIEHQLQMLDSTATSIDELQISIKKEEESLNIKSIEEYLVELKKKRNSVFKQAFIEVPISCTKDEFEEFFVFLKNQQRILTVTYEYGKEPIREVIKNMKKNEDIPTLIAASLLALESQHNKERLSIIDRLINRYAGIKITCENECPLKYLHQELLELKDSEPVNNVKFTEEFYQMMKLSYDNISTVFDALSTKKEVIKKLPADIQKMFTIDSICEKITNCTLIYDDKVLNELLSFLTERDNYFKIEKEIETVEIDLKTKKENSRVEFLSNELSKEKDNFKSINETLENYRNTLDELDEDIEAKDKSLINFKTMEEALINFEEELDKLHDLKTRIDKSTELIRELSIINNGLYDLKKVESDTRKKLYNTQSSLENYKRLKENLKVQKMTFDDFSNLKFALSNKTGIPLEYIKDYLKKTVSIANQIIDIAYNGKLELGEFEITEDEFKMPYIKNGTTIADVTSSSQGEESFFNLAISSALRSQSMTRFNIGLFDEVDSEFDDNNRQHFIPVLEKTLELNGINQAFLITHNLMFRQYPVDIINLGDLDASTVSINYK